MRPILSLVAWPSLTWLRRYYELVRDTLKDKRLGDSFRLFAGAPLVRFLPPELTLHSPRNEVRFRRSLPRTTADSLPPQSLQRRNSSLQLWWSRPEVHFARRNWPVVLVRLEARHDPRSHRMDREGRRARLDRWKQVRERFSWIGSAVPEEALSVSPRSSCGLCRSLIVSREQVSSRGSLRRRGSQFCRELPLQVGQVIRIHPLVGWNQPKGVCPSNSSRSRPEIEEVQRTGSSVQAIRGQSQRERDSQVAQSPLPQAALSLPASTSWPPRKSRGGPAARS